MASPHRPMAAEVVERVVESHTIVTLRLRLTEPVERARYRFRPGQFNMLYRFGAGEVPISLSSDPDEPELLGHTIRAVGRVTRALCELAPGERLGVRGPYGCGWPLEQAEGRDVVVVTGGLGCAPAVSVIHYIERRRARYRRLVILQGVKHADDLIWRGHYERWAALPDTQVLLAADRAGPGWPGHIGRVTTLLEQARFDPVEAVVMLCGPEVMMRAAVAVLLARGVAEHDLWLSLERNMQCGIGLCGHCQIGPRFVCRDGPVIAYPRVRRWLEHAGF